ncbi:MAG: potassium channel protein [Desulfosarcinaceae bacterium]|nr:potassium channel protein [Desulfosarcinaceae bacterium]
MDRVRQTLISIVLSIALILGGSFGYMIIEGWNFFDSLYMTVITIATVGFSEIHTVSVAGRTFTLLLIFLGVGYFLYVAGGIIQVLVEGRIRHVLGRHKLHRRINRLRNHYIVCGYGRIGRSLTRHLTQRYLDVVVIEQSAERLSRMDDDGILYLLGEATSEEMLIKAGVKRAKAIVTAVGTDADNVFLVLIAKQINPKIFVVARASQNATKKTLIAAGADKVVSPYDLGARRMAHAILRPTVIEFLEMAFADDTTDVQVEELPVSADSALTGVTLMESGIRQKYDLIIITIKKADGSMHFNPGADARIEANDTVIVVGQGKDLKRLERKLMPAKSDV